MLDLHPFGLRVVLAVRRIYSPSGKAPGTPNVHFPRACPESFMGSRLRLGHYWPRVLRIYGYSGVDGPR